MELQKCESVIGQVSPFKEVTAGQKYILQKNLVGLMNQVLRDCVEFQSTTQQKIKALQQLKHICCVTDFQEHLTLIFKTLSKQLLNDEGVYQSEVKNVCFVIGARIPAEYYLPTLLNLVQVEEQGSQQRLLQSVLCLITETIQHETDALDISGIIHVLIQVEQSFADQFDVMDQIFRLATRVIQISSNQLSIYARQIFQVILSVKAFTNLKQDYQTEIERSLNLLATKCGYSSVTDLHTNEVNVMLDTICHDEQYKNWKHSSRDFNKFKAVVQGCGEGVARFLPQITQIMQHSLALEADIELRLDTLLLLDGLVRIQSIRESIKLYGTLIFNNLLISAMIWKIGKPNAKIRKASVIIANYLIELLSEAEINEIFPQLSAPLKTCLNDDWAPDLRFVACHLTSRIMQLCPSLEFERIREFYPSLLERLDDSQNPIRIEACRGIGFLFANPEMTKTTISEYIIEAVLIHLDDSNEEVQKAVFECLLKSVPKSVLLAKAEQSVKNFKYPRWCSELIRMTREC